jgi:hypothetical protein
MFTEHGVESWQLDPISFEPKLDYENYSLWSLRTKIILKSRGLWRLVEGLETIPADAEAVELERWKMRDASAQLQLLTNIPDKWVWIFGQTSTAKEAWSALLELFQPQSMFKQSLAMRKFSELKAAEDGDVRAHVIRMSELWHQVLATGAQTPGDESEKYFVDSLLRSLPPSWSSFTQSWGLAMDETKVSRPTIIGHILDTDAWNRGRAEAHKKQSNGQRKPRSSKIVQD